MSWPWKKRAASGDGELIEAISQHIERHVGPVAEVFHELISPDIHVDIYRVEPTAALPVQTLVTSGMSEIAMQPPSSAKRCTHAEIVAFLPPDWKLELPGLMAEETYWPVRWMKMLARLPHETGSWLWLGHTVQLAEDGGARAGHNPFHGVLMTPAHFLPDQFGRLRVKDGREIQMLAMVPLYAEEMQYLIDHGPEPMWDLVENSGIPLEVLATVSPSRPNMLDAVSERS